MSNAARSDSEVAPAVGPEEGQEEGPLLRRIADGVLEAVVASFALWTLLYCLGLPTQWSLWPSGWLWAIATLALLIWRVAAALPSRTPPATTLDADALEGGTASRLSARLGDRLPLLLIVGLVLAALSAATGFVWSAGTFRITWLLLVVAMAVLMLWSVASGRVVPGLSATGDQPAAASLPTSPLRFSRGVMEELGVLAVMLMTAVLTLFVHLADTDDPYYLNRSVWVAERGNAALLDTMFSPEVLNSPYGGGVPISSIEALFGVVAHMTGLRAGTVTYFIGAPLAAALAVLATWRLVRRWAPRRAFLVFLAAIAFLMLSGDSMLGNFWIVRIWQGKVIAVVFLMPLIWSYLVDVQESRTRRERWWSTGLLLAAGIAFFGLTPTAVVWGPVMLVAVAFAALLLRSRALLIGGVALAVGPIVSGLAVVAFSTDVGGVDPVALTARESFVRVLGTSLPMVAITLLALALAVVLTRRGAPAALAGSAALAAVVIFAPGILPLANAVTGSGPILWRMLDVAPIPVLVGLLLSAPIPGMASMGAVTMGKLKVPGLVVVLVPALCLLAGLATGGRPVWSHTGHGGPVTLTARPEWKLDVEALHDVEILADQGLSGEVLLPPRWMKVLTMYTTDAFPVVPREWFIQNMEEPQATTNARRLLYAVAGGTGRLPSQSQVTQALALLDVNLACTGESPNRSRVVDLFTGAGFARTSKVGTLTCARRPS